jgi:hypothetical protein
MSTLVKTKTIDLIEPIKIAGVEVKQLTARVLRVRDRLAVEDASKDANDIEKELHLMALMVGVAPEELYDMHLADYKQVQAVFSDFLSSPTQKKSEAQSGS